MLNVDATLIYPTLVVLGFRGLDTAFCVICFSNGAFWAHRQGDE